MSKHLMAVRIALAQQNRNDDALSLFAAKQLTYLETKVHQKVEESISYTKVFPLNFEGALGMDSITSTWGEENGLAKQVGNSGTDFPRVSAGEEEIIYPVKNYGLEYGLTILDIEKARFANKNVETKLAMATNRGMEKAVNNCFWKGDGALRGIFDKVSITNLSSYTLPADGNSNGGSSSKKLRHKTAEQIETQLVAMRAVATSVYNGVFPIDTLVLEPEDYNYIVSIKSHNAESMLVVEYLQKIGFKNIISASEMATAFDNGTKAGVLMLPKDPEVLEARIPVPKRALPAHFNGWEFVTKYLLACSGVHLYHPKKIIFAKY